MGNRLIGYVLVSLSLLYCQSLAMHAQEIEPPESNQFSGQWYIGLRGGLPFGVSTFCSFGEDKTRPGFSAGVYGGYRFSSLLSLEAQAVWGSMRLSAHDCCMDYWLGADGNRYYVPVSGMQGWDYSDLYSRVGFQRYGLQLNVDVLQFFRYNPEKRWSIKVSPLLAIVGTKATIKTIGENKPVMQKSNDWHLGAGGSLSVGYRITGNLSFALYSDITWLTGKRMDGMPKYMHNVNYIWESGLKLGWTFGKYDRKSEPAPAILPLPPSEPSLPEQSEPAALTEPPPAPPIPEKEVNSEYKPVTIEFPVIYFAFNSIAVTPVERRKIQKTLSMLRQYPDMKIVVTGWCDKRGTVEVNKRVSELRAQVVRNWIVKNNIAPERVSAIGRGIDYNTVDAAKARRVETRKEEAQ